MADVLDALIVGAGPAGLATSRELSRQGVRHLVLERGDDVGHVWANLYDGLVLHTGKHFSALPGLPFPPGTPLFPTRLHFLDYLRAYARGQRLPVRTNADVTRIERGVDDWMVRTADGGEFRARSLVVATGIVSNPHVPSFPGQDAFRGRVIHSVDYRRPAGFAGAHVVVVGAGNSAGEIAVELARAGASVSVSVRSGARVVPRELLGVPIQYVAVALGALPKPMTRAVTNLVTNLSARARGTPVFASGPSRQCSNVPLIGFHLVDAIRSGAIRLLPGIAGFTRDGVRLSDGVEVPADCVMLATGFRAALAPLGGLVQLDDCGFAARRDRVLSDDHPDLYFVGHNYDTSGGLRNIARDARIAARFIRGSRLAARG